MQKSITSKHGVTKYRDPYRDPFIFHYKQACFTGNWRTVEAM